MTRRKKAPAKKAASKRPRARLGSLITVDHVYTVFKASNWRVSPNLSNSMQVVSTRKTWLDTANMNDIKVTVQGDNYVTHDMPAKSK